MPGRVTFVPSPKAVCERPAGCLDKPRPEAHARGTIWTCDVCGREWVVVTGSQFNEHYSAWRILTAANREGYDR